MNLFDYLTVTLIRSMHDLVNFIVNGYIKFSIVHLAFVCFQSVVRSMWHFRNVLHVVVCVGTQALLGNSGRYFSENSGRYCKSEINRDIGQKYSLKRK